MNPIAFQIGPLPVHWYGILIVTGALLGAWLASKLAEARGDDPEHVWNLLTWCLILGIIGARLYHVISSPVGAPGQEVAGWQYYKNHPLDAINPFQGISNGQVVGFSGLGIYGAIAGGALAVLIYTWRHRLTVTHWLDISAPGLLVGQIIGRWGNFINQELFGGPTDLPWGIHIDPDRLQGTPFPPEQYANARFHPLFLYESLWNLLMLGVILYITRRWGRKLKNGDVFLMYLIAYPLGRLWVESFRWDAWKLGALGIPTAQVISIACILFSAALLYWRHRPGSSPANPSTMDPDPKQQPVATPVRPVPEAPASSLEVSESPVQPAVVAEGINEEAAAEQGEEPQSPTSGGNKPGSDALPA